MKELEVATASDGRGLPVVAIVGRPNVGKSSLVNRVLGRREAIVEEMPGVTRDRRSFVAEWAGRDFEIVDTGGLEPGAKGLEKLVGEQAEAAILAADVLVLVVDAVAGPNQDDLEVAERLRRSGKPALVAANKVDDGRDEPLAAAFYRMGLGDPHPVSALHGRGSGDLLDAIVRALPDERGAATDVWTNLAIVGRPNVGKSSLLNALVGENRSIVDAVPGTTRDPVDSYIQLADERRIRLIDTAGMRREVQLKDPLEYFSFLRSRGTVERADVVLLVVDISEGVTGHDQRIADEVVAAGRACVIVLNKWDLLGGDESDRKRLDRDVADRIRFLSWAPIVRTSALTKRGVDKVLPAVERSMESYRKRLTTSTVNRIVQNAQERRPHPRIGGRSARVLYAVQASVEPPTIVLFTTARLSTEYLRYLENRIREEEPFVGSPLRLHFRIRTRREVKG
jgi:GTPase